MKILITGGAGFIGSHLGNSLVKSNEVLSVDNFSNSFPSNLNKNVKNFEIDVSTESYDRFLKSQKFDVIINCAAQSSGEASFDHPIVDFNSNTLGVLRTLENIKNTNTHLIHFSTMSIYGDGGENVNEKHLPSPKSYYAVSKLNAENYINFFKETYGINATTFRLFNIYGPGQNLENLKQGMVSIYLAQMLHDKSITVKGSLERYRDFVFIDDLVEIVTSEIKLKACQTINISTNIATTVGQLIDVMTTLGGLPKNRVFFSGNTNGDVTGITGDNTLLRTLYQKNTWIDIKEGINRTLQY
jgi:UDP-glucose 4-epimerase